MLSLVNSISVLMRHSWDLSALLGPIFCTILHIFLFAFKDRPLEIQHINIVSLRLNLLFLLFRLWVVVRLFQLDITSSYYQRKNHLLEYWHLEPGILQRCIKTENDHFLVTSDSSFKGTHISLCDILATLHTNIIERTRDTACSCMRTALFFYYLADGLESHIDFLIEVCRVDAMQKSLRPVKGHVWLMHVICCCVLLCDLRRLVTVQLEGNSVVDKDIPLPWNVNAAMCTLILDVFYLIATFERWWRVMEDGCSSPYHIWRSQ